MSSIKIVGRVGLVALLLFVSLIPGCLDTGKEEYEKEIIGKYIKFEIGRQRTMEYGKAWAVGSAKREDVLEAFAWWEDRLIEAQHIEARTPEEYINFQSAYQEEVSKQLEAVRDARAAVLNEDEKLLEDSLKRIHESSESITQALQNFQIIRDQDSQR